MDSAKEGPQGLKPLVTGEHSCTAKAALHPKAKYLLHPKSGGFCVTSIGTFEVRELRVVVGN